jgi:hypothetical protein
MNLMWMRTASWTATLNEAVEESEADGALEVSLE